MTSRASRALVLVGTDDTQHATRNTQHDALGSGGAWRSNPFEEFLAYLLAHESKPVRVLAGSAIWTGLPVEEMVMDGLWIVMGAVAGKLGASMTTETHAWDDMAPRVNRLVNAGLVLAYETIDAAAEAFRTDVVGAVRDQLASLPDGATAIPSSLWQHPSMRFFAALVKRAREEGEQIGRLYARVARFNEADEKRGIVYLDEHFSGFDSYAAYLTMEFVKPKREKMETPDESETMLERKIAGAVSELQALVQLQNILRLLPLRLSAIHEGAASSTPAPSIEDHWLNTQLLLAAAQAPEAFEDIDTEDFVSCLTTLQSLSDAVLLDRFWQRMAERGRSFAAHQQAVLLPHLVARIRELRQLKKVFSVDYHPQAFLHLNYQRAVVTGENAIKYAAGWGGELLRSLTAADRERFFRDEVVPKIRWENVILEELEEILECDMLPIEEIVSGIARMPREIRKEAVDALFASVVKPNRKAIARLLLFKLVKLTTDFLVKHLENVPRARIAAYFPAFIREAEATIAKDVRRAAWLAEFVIKLGLRLGSVRERNLFDRPDLRQAIRLIFLEFFIHAETREKLLNVGMRIEFLFFQSTIGNDLWDKYVLGCEVCYREGIYSGRDLRNDRELDEQELAPWEKMGSAKRAEWLMWIEPEMFGPKIASMRKAIKAHTEDEIFSWLHAAEPDVKKRLAKYRADRKRYYARKAKERKTT